VSVEIVERARRSFRINPYAVLLSCQGVDQVMTAFSGRPDLFRYGVQRDGWKLNFGDPKLNEMMALPCENKPKLTEEDRRLLSRSHVWMHMRGGSLQAAYDERGFKKVVEAFETLGLKSLKVEKQPCGSGDRIELDVVLKWFQEKLAADRDLIQASLKADSGIGKAKQLAGEKKPEEALKLLQGLLDQKGRLLPQACAKLEAEVAALKGE